MNLYGCIRCGNVAVNASGIVDGPLGLYLKSARLAAGVDKTELAAAMKLRLAQYNALEEGEGSQPKLTILHLEQAAKATDVPLPYMMGKKGWHGASLQKGERELPCWMVVADDGRLHLPSAWLDRLQATDPATLLRTLGGEAAGWRAKDVKKLQGGRKIPAYGDMRVLANAGLVGGDGWNPVRGHWDNLDPLRYVPYPEPVQQAMRAIRKAKRQGKMTLNGNSNMCDGILYKRVRSAFNLWCQVQHVDVGSEKATTRELFYTIGKMMGLRTVYGLSTMDLVARRVHGSSKDAFSTLVLAVLAAALEVSAEALMGFQPLPTVQKQLDARRKTAIPMPESRAMPEPRQVSTQSNWADPRAILQAWDDLSAEGASATA